MRVCVCICYYTLIMIPIWLFFSFFISFHGRLKPPDQRSYSDSAYYLTREVKTHKPKNVTKDIKKNNDCRIHNYIYYISHGGHSASLLLFQYFILFFSFPKSISKRKKTLKRERAHNQQVLMRINISSENMRGGYLNSALFIHTVIMRILGKGKTIGSAQISSFVLFF